MKKMLILIGGLAVALTSFVVASGQSPQAPNASTPNVQEQHRRRAGRRHLARRRARLGAARALRSLNLTDAQKQQAQSIMRSNFESNKAVREELKQLVQKRRQGGTLTEAEQARARELRQQLQQSRKNARTQLATLLTEEQKTKLEERRKHRRERRERSGRRGLNKPI